MKFKTMVLIEMFLLTGLSPCFAESDSQASLEKQADRITAEEIEYRERIRDLERQREVARLRKEINEFKSFGSDDLGFSGGAGMQSVPLIPVQDVPGEMAAGADSIESPPQPVGYRSGKVLFRTSNGLRYAQTGDRIGGYTITEASATEVVMKSRDGAEVQIPIVWTPSQD